jgi:phage-related holin
MSGCFLLIDVICSFFGIIKFCGELDFKKGFIKIDKKVVLRMAAIVEAVS